MITVWLKLCTSPGIVYTHYLLMLRKTKILTNISR